MALAVTGSVHDHHVVERVCRHLRAALGADGVAVWRADPPAVVAGSGLLPHPGRLGVEAMPVVYGDDPVAQLTWCGPIDASAHRGLMLAAADIVAPLVASMEAWPSAPTPGAQYGLVGVSEALGRVRQQIPRFAAAPMPVLVEGESGVGKELVARAVHAAGPRRGGPFVPVNCAAFSDELVDAELFGHAKGAFTGALLDRRGLVEAAHGGTLFLDEVAELSPRAQAKLLRVLQEGEVRRVGETQARMVDVRVVSATNRALVDEVAAGRFRLDLRYRLEVLRVHVPPLRVRRDDIPVLALHFWQQTMQRLRRTARLAPSVVAALRIHSWPGNARELQNVVAAIAAAGPPRGLVGREDLPDLWAAAARDVPCTLADARTAFERDFVLAAFERCGRRPAVVARELGMTRQGLAKLSARLGVDGRRSGTGQQP